MANSNLKVRLTGLRRLLLASAVTLGLGLALPCLTMQPGFWGAEHFLPIGETQTKSILTGIYHLAEGGDLFLAGLLLGFSVIFPVWKLCVFYGALYRLEHGMPLSKSLKFAEKLGKFSMLDVIVMGMLVLSFQSFPGGTRIHVQWGIGFFFVSVILSVIAAIQIKALAGDLKAKAH